MWWFLLVSCGSSPEPVPVASTADTAPLRSVDTGHTSHTNDTIGTTTVPTGDDALPQRLGLLTLNLHCLKLDGTRHPDHEARWAAIAAEVAAGEVDVLALQEVCVRDDLDALGSLEAALEAATGDAWEGAFAFAHVAWEGTSDEADEGVALLSRVGLGAPTELGYVDPGALRRVGLFATLDDGTTVSTVHFEVSDTAERESQARQTASQLLAAAGSLDVVLAGDLNDREGSPTHGAFGSMGYLDVSDELALPRIDYAFAHRGGRWRAGAQALWFRGADAVSDHPGVFVELVASPPDEVLLTRVVAQVDVGFGHTLAVRGDAAPLSWERGWWAWPVAADRWELVLTEVSGSFAFKTLVDDQTWQVGDDVSADAGQEVLIRPTY